MRDERTEHTTVADRGKALGLTTLSLARHRSVDRLTLSRTTLFGLLLVPVLFNAIEWQSQDRLSAIWTDILAFWLRGLKMDGMVGERLTTIGWVDVTLPYLDLAVDGPDARTWWISLAISVVGCVCARYIRGSFLPLRYLLIFAICIEATALFFFAVSPQGFPYTVSGYVDNIIKTSVAFLLLLPWGHSLVYYIFDFPWASKLLLTVLSIAFVGVAVPLQVVMHVFVLSRCSLLMMPLLSFVFGPTMLVLGCIALYGWAMSWKRVHR